MTSTWGTFTIYPFEKGLFRPLSKRSSTSYLTVLLMERWSVNIAQIWGENTEFQLSLAFLVG